MDEKVNYDKALLLAGSLALTVERLLLNKHQLHEFPHITADVALAWIKYERHFIQWSGGDIENRVDLKNSQGTCERYPNPEHK